MIISQYLAFRMVQTLSVYVLPPVPASARAGGHGGPQNGCNGHRLREHSNEPDLNPSGSGEEVLLQGFNWECSGLRDSHKRPCWLAGLADKAEQIAEAGITAVWLPPPCQSIAAEGYMPQVRMPCCRTKSHRAVVES